MRNQTRLLMAMFILVSLGAGLAAPGQEVGKSDSKVVITDTVSAVMKELRRTVPPPKTANKDVIAGEIDIRYPEFTSSTGPNAAIESINKVIQTRLLTLFGDKTPTTLEQLTESFAKGYEESVKESPDMPGAWSLKFAVTIRHADADLVSLEILDSIFTGGAHPNSSIDYLVFSLRTGEPIQFSALIPEEKAGELNKIAEQHFRRIRGLKAEETLEQAGFQFEKNEFNLNRNFLVSQAGLAFCFNQYEIGPYSMGITELVIPWSDLRTVVEPKGPAGRFLN